MRGQGMVGWAGSWPPQRHLCMQQRISPSSAACAFPALTPFRRSAAEAKLQCCPLFAGVASSSGQAGLGGGAVAGETGLVDRRGRGRAAKLAGGGQGRRGQQWRKGQGSEARRARVSMQWRVGGLGRAWVIPASQHRSSLACVPLPHTSLASAGHHLSYRATPLLLLSHPYPSPCPVLWILGEKRVQVLMPEPRIPSEEDGFAMTPINITFTVGALLGCCLKRKRVCFSGCAPTSSYLHV